MTELKGQRAKAEQEPERNDGTMKLTEGAHRKPSSHMAQMAGQCRRSIIASDGLSHDESTKPSADRCMPGRRAHNGISIIVGPSLANPSFSAFPNESSDVTRVPGTPIPFAN
jgi:hypothetical protein